MLVTESRDQYYRLLIA